MKRTIKKLSILLLSLLFVAGSIPASVMAAATPSVSYCTHVQNEGWQNYVSNGEMSGTSGKSLRLEGIKIKIDTQGYDLGVSYQTHIQNIGWEADASKGWKADDEMSGTQGLSYRLEAIQIKLTGADADKFDIYYQVHAQNMGWLGWAKNGESAGTAGFGYRLEGIRIVIVPVGSAVPNGKVDKEDPFYENPEAPFSEILDEYKTAKANDYYDGDLSKMPNVNSELYTGSGRYHDLLYIVADISGDAVPEMVISHYKSNSNTYEIMDMYRLVNGKPERIFEVYSMGNRIHYTICENQTVKVIGGGGADTTYYHFYKLNGDNSTLIQYVLFERPNYYLTDETHKDTLLSEYNAKSIINSFIPRTDINWIKL